jgi:hypothetical protein
LLVCLVASDAFAASPPLTVYLAPPEENIDVKAIEAGSSKEAVLSPQEKTRSRRSYVLEKKSLSQLAGKFPLLNLVVQADRDSATEPLENITIRIPAVVAKKDSYYVRLFLTDPEVSPKSIRQFQIRGLDGEAGYRTYFEARKIYKRVLSSRSPRHPLIVPAAYWFFASAYKLASNPGSIIAFDQESLQASEHVLTLAKDKIVAQGFSHYSVDIKHWTAMLAKAKRLGWQDFSFVKKAASGQQFEAAYALNDHFSKRYFALEKEAQAVVTREYGINAALLEKNDKFIRQRIKLQ